MSDLFSTIKEQVQQHQPAIVFPEGTDERVLRAAVQLKEERIVKPILIGDLNAIKDVAKQHGIRISSDLTIYNPADYAEFDAMVEAFVERRKGKETEESARKILLDVNYFGTMLVYMDKAEGLVSG